MMDRRLVWSIVLLLAGLGRAFGAQQPAPSESRPLAYGISGKVVDARTGAPLGRCSVRIADVKQRSDSRSVLSGDDGGFAFDGLAMGKYSLTAQRRGYMEQSYEEHDQFSTAIAVGPGLASEGLIFRLTAEAVIAGIVTDEAGEPVRGAQVRLFQDQNARGIRATTPRQAMMTDDRGAYEVAGLHPGAYFLAVTASPWYAQRLQRGIEASSGTRALDLAYPMTLYPGVADQDAATPIPVKGGDRLEANITLAAQPALRLRLNLPAAEESGASGVNRGVSVMLSQSVFGQTENRPARVSVGPDGSAEIDGILPGHYDVAVNDFGRGEQPGNGPRHFEADIGSGATELTADSGVGEVTITGKVVSADGKLPSFSGISLRNPHGRRQQYGELNGSGEFSETVLPGTYEVAGNVNGMYIASLKAIGASLVGRMLTVKAGDSPKLDIVVGAGFGEIEGTAILGEKPASAVMVLLAPEDPRNNEILFRRDQSDSDGTFDLPNVLPGRYRLLAIDHGWDIEWANPAVLQAFLAKSVAVEVKPGDHLNRRVEVQQR